MVWSFCSKTVRILMYSRLCNCLLLLRTTLPLPSILGRNFGKNLLTQLKDRWMLWNGWIYIGPKSEKQKGVVYFFRPRYTSGRFLLTLKGLYTWPVSGRTGFLVKSQLPKGTFLSLPMTKYPFTGWALLVTRLDKLLPLSISVTS